MMKGIEMNKAYPKIQFKDVLRVGVKQVVKLYRASNRYFFGNDEISLHDFLWFYGGLSFMVSSIFIIKVLSKLLY